ncbi:hypothetical protein [Croceimicrobium hydrocarbonivorans]|uniref:Uncharacterized protein n=1 Tax=Croceimicrobium hydrocarbonivorans TaxID=2761580 RepID=A0A7H0VIP8_9FLAO|nr:hypothetical protein [Croceimicrobium hydrocarbonivorans]QNR25596.1 hypothetical protein H4K34_07065 [Croceimicrobium hydrocarbonivorans]
MKFLFNIETGVRIHSTQLTDPLSDVKQEIKPFFENQAPIIADVDCIFVFYRVFDFPNDFKTVSRYSKKENCLTFTYAETDLEPFQKDDKVKIKEYMKLAIYKALLNVTKTRGFKGKDEILEMAENFKTSFNLCP